MLRSLAVLVLAGLLTAGAFSLRERDRISRMDASIAARRELAETPLAPTGTAPRAGVSARAPIRVQPLPDRLARQLRGDPDFHRFSHRCGVCHVSPDPALYDETQWPEVVARMAGTVEAAGLLSVSDADREAVLRVLRQYARSRP